MAVHLQGDDQAGNGHAGGDEQMPAAVAEPVGAGTEGNHAEEACDKGNGRVDADMQHVLHPQALNHGRHPEDKQIGGTVHHEIHE